MNKARVVWGARKPIGPDKPDQLRTMTREFGSAKAAAEFACDILFVLEGYGTVGMGSEKYYTVSRDKPRVQFDNASRTMWVEVTYLPPGVGSNSPSAPR